MKPVGISDSLAKIVGRGPMPRTEVTKKVWDYIKKHKLQDTRNKRQINPDELLSDVVGKKSITMFELTKHISTHIKEPTAASR